MFTLWEGIILGAIQGLAEWLPISSEALVSLVALQLFDINESVVIDLALMLHLGTMLAAVIYFRHTIIDLLRQWRQNKSILLSISVITFISLGLGGVIYLFLANLSRLAAAGAILTLVMGIALLITAWLLSRRHDGQRDFATLSIQDGIFIGLVQGLALIPGISRSGSTTAVALWRKLSPDAALTTSFIISIPMIAIGIVVLSFGSASTAMFLSAAGIAALLSSFVVGWITIDLFMRIARRVNFAKFVAIIGILSIIAGILDLL